MEVDGKPLEVLDNDVSLDNADGLNLRHSFGEVSGEQIKITSFLPSKLSSNHIQILKLIRNDKEISRQFLTGDDNEFVFDFDELQTPDSFGQFLTLGIKHIAFGFDHLLFLLALLLVVTKFSEIAKIVTFFTIAHSITLSLVALNIISVPSLFGRADNCRFDNLCRLGKRLQNRTKKALADRIYFRFGSRFGFCVRFAGNRNRRRNFSRDAAFVF